MEGSGGSPLYAITDRPSGRYPIRVRVPEQTLVTIEPVPAWPESVAQELFSVADVFAWTIVLVALLFLLEAIVARIETRLLRWRA